MHGACVTCRTVASALPVYVGRTNPPSLVSATTSVIGALFSKPAARGTTSRPKLVAGPTRNDTLRLPKTSACQRKKAAAHSAQSCRTHELQRCATSAANGSARPCCSSGASASSTLRTPAHAAAAFAVLRTASPAPATSSVDSPPPLSCAAAASTACVDGRSAPAPSCSARTSTEASCAAALKRRACDASACRSAGARRSMTLRGASHAGTKSVWGHCAVRYAETGRGERDDERIRGACSRGVYRTAQHCFPLPTRRRNRRHAARRAAGCAGAARRTGAHARLRKRRRCHAARRGRQPRGCLRAGRLRRAALPRVHAAGVRGGAKHREKHGPNHPGAWPRGGPSPPPSTPSGGSRRALTPRRSP